MHIFSNQFQENSLWIFVDLNIGCAQVRKSEKEPLSKHVFKAEFNVSIRIV